MGARNLVAQMVSDKRRWWAYKARVRQLPESYRTAVDAIERYLMYAGGTSETTAATMFEDLADLFEQAAADGTPVRQVVGDDPVEFIETFVLSYGQGSWITRERDRLSAAIAAASQLQEPRP